MGEAKAKRIACYTEAQQGAYEALNEAQRRYVDYRALGYSKVEAYRKAGYVTAKNAAVNACQLEKKPIIADLVQTRLRAKTAQDTYDKENKLSKQIEAMAEQQGVLDKGREQAVESVLDGGDAEMASRVKFYRDIAAGKIRTVKRTTFIGKDGKESYKIEETADVAVRVLARKELDRLLGLTDSLDLGKMQVGDITIKFVDSTKKDEANIIDLKNEDSVVVGEAEADAEAEREAKGVEDVESARS